MKFGVLCVSCFTPYPIIELDNNGAVIPENNTVKYVFDNEYDSVNGFYCGCNDNEYFYPTSTLLRLNQQLF